MHRVRFSTQQVVSTSGTKSQWQPAEDGRTRREKQKAVPDDHSALMARWKRMTTCTRMNWPLLTSAWGGSLIVPQNRNQGQKWNERTRETEIQRYRETETEKQRDRDRDREKKKEIERYWKTYQGPENKRDRTNTSQAISI